MTSTEHGSDLSASRPRTLVHARSGVLCSWQLQAAWTKLTCAAVKGFIDNDVGIGAQPGVYVQGNFRAALPEASRSVTKIA